MESERVTETVGVRRVVMMQLVPDARDDWCSPHASSLLGFGVHRLQVKAVADASQQHWQELWVELLEGLFGLLHLKQDDEGCCDLHGQTGG